MFANGFMGIKTIDECFYYIQNGANIKQAENSGGYPITRIETTSNDRFNRDRMGYAGITDLAKYSTYILEDDDLLMSHINSVRYLGRTVLYKKIGDEIIIHGMNLLRLKADKSIILPKYAKYYFYSYNFRSQLANITKKSVNQASFAVKDLKRIKIDVPQLENQKIVINTLDKLQSIITHLRTQLEKLDLLVKARFVELFGDYHTNNKGFESHKGKDLFKFSSGRFLSEEKRFEKGIPVYGGNGIAWYTEKPLIDYPTIIIGRVGAWCGNIHTIYEPVWITDNAIYIKEQKTSKFTLEFLAELMKIMDFRQYADFSGQPKITQKPLETLEYLTPPINMQNEFTEFCKQIEKSKSILQQELTQTQTLFDSLMQEYFG